MDIDGYLQSLIKELLQLWDAVDALMHTVRPTLNDMMFFILPLVTSLRMQIYLDGVQKIDLLVHLVTKVHILCGWKME